jgi:hypothetical protein
MPRNWNPNDLLVIVPACLSIDGVLKELEIPLSGGNRETVKRWIKKLSLDTNHFTGQGHRKGSSIPVFEAATLTEILVENSGYTNTHRLKLRLIKEGLIEARCNCCKMTKWMNLDIPLELHHKDGVKNNHSFENLELLCPNCHAITDNYRAKNIRAPS